MRNEPRARVGASFSVPLPCRVGSLYIHSPPRYNSTCISLSPSPFPISTRRHHTAQMAAAVSSWIANKLRSELHSSLVLPNTSDHCLAGLIRPEVNVHPLQAVRCVRRGGGKKEENTAPSRCAAVSVLPFLRRGEKSHGTGPAEAMPCRHTTLTALLRRSSLHLFITTHAPQRRAGRGGGRGASAAGARGEAP